MNTMFEVLYPRPRNPACAQKVSRVVASHDGKLECVEETEIAGVSSTVTLTFVFASRVKAEAAASALFALGHHVEGLGDYPA